ncbi:hypothetical protein ACK3F5_15360 [Photorhabdus asymbiotica UENP]|uniref:hypothetical protein n=1 Tax=Photorhabdus TaxID=29487 RepID=UPI0014739F45|nr:hypothetical protein [Photorhabdus asymbiotica]
MTGVSERSQQSSNLKDDGYIQYITTRYHSVNNKYRCYLVTLIFYSKEKNLKIKRISSTS